MVTAAHPADTVPVGVVKTIAEHVRAAVMTRYTVDSCIASTAVFIDVADWLGLDASPAAVDVLAANPAALRVMANDPAPPVDQWPPEAWTVGVLSSEPPREGGWPGHLVAILHGHRDRLVDVSADQLDRPSRGLRVPSPVLGRLPKRWGDGDQCVTHLHASGTMLRWTLRSGNTAWRESPNWVSASPEQKASRESVLSLAKTRLTNAGITPAAFTAAAGGA